MFWPTDIVPLILSTIVLWVYHSRNIPFSCILSRIKRNECNVPVLYLMFFLFNGFNCRTILRNIIIIIIPLQLFYCCKRTAVRFELSRSPFHVHVLIVLIKRLFSLLLITEFNSTLNRWFIVVRIIINLSFAFWSNYVRLSIDPSFPTMNIFKFFVSSSKVYF